MGRGVGWFLKVFIFFVEEVVFGFWENSRVIRSIIFI